MCEQGYICRLTHQSYEPMNHASAAPFSDDHETARLKELYSLGLLDTLSDIRFDQYTQLASEIFEAPIALISLVDANRQWFKSSCGLDAKETARDISFCTHAILGDGEFVIEDALADERFRDNPLVTGEPNIRFYAGGVIRGPAGYALGTCCVIDRAPRIFGARERRMLSQLARMVEYEIESRALLKNLRAEVERNASPQWSKQLDLLIDGRL